MDPGTKFHPSAVPTMQFVWDSTFQISVSSVLLSARRLTTESENQVFSPVFFIRKWQNHSFYSLNMWEIIPL